MERVEEGRGERERKGEEGREREERDGTGRSEFVLCPKKEKEKSAPMTLTSAC